MVVCLSASVVVSQAPASLMMCFLFSPKTARSKFAHVQALSVAIVNTVRSVLNAARRLLVCTLLVSFYLNC